MSNMIISCAHCGEYKSTEGKFCHFCSTAEKRKAMDKENEKIGVALKAKYA